MKIKPNIRLSVSEAICWEIWVGKSSLSTRKSRRCRAGPGEPGTQLRRARFVDPANLRARFIDGAGRQLFFPHDEGASPQCSSVCGRHDAVARPQSALLPENVENVLPPFSFPALTVFVGQIGHEIRKAAPAAPFAQDHLLRIHSRPPRLISDRTVSLYACAPFSQFTLSVSIIQMTGRSRYSLRVDGARGDQET